MTRKHCRRTKPDPLLRTQPWKVHDVFSPIERVLHRIEADGTVDAAGATIVFREESRGGWYDLVAALTGVIEFHQLATIRYGIPCDVAPMVRFATKLEHGAQLFQADVDSVRRAIDCCKAQALQLRVSQANDIVNTVRISMAMDHVRTAEVSATC